MARRAVISGAGKPLRLEDCGVPETPSGQIRVRIACSGVCHTDLHVRNDEGATFRAQFGEDIFNKMILGHEIAGYVDDIGSGVDVKSLEFRKGDRVVVYPWLGCQKCSVCLKGSTNNCQDEKMLVHSLGVSPLHPGGYQTHLTINPKFVLKVPESIPLDIACLLACSGGTAYSAVNKIRESVEFGSSNSASGKSRILIIGAGGLGLWTVKLAKVLYGDKVDITVADLDQGKIDIAKKYGADDGVLWTRSSTEEQNVEAATKKGPIYAVVDFVGSSATISSGVKCLIRNGTYVLVGIAGGTLNIPGPLLVSNQINVRGCLVFDMNMLRDLLKLVEEHKITYPEIRHFSLDEVNTALDLLGKGQINGRAVLKQE